MENIIQQFKDNWAIILGGSSGFGFASVEKLAKHGMNIAVLYRETARTERALLTEFEKIAEENSVQILPYNFNALEEEGRRKFIQQFSKSAGKKNCVKLMLHSIARGNLKPLIQQNEATTDVLSAGDFQLTSYAMAISLIDWVRLVLKENLFCTDARIISLTSGGAHTYWEGYAAVSIAKSSLESLSTYMAVEFGKYGLKTNLIQAGITETPSLKKIPGNKNLIELATSVNPLGRITKPQDVANVVYLLCTDEAVWINGALIHVDGGEHCR